MAAEERLKAANLLDFVQLFNGSADEFVKTSFHPITPFDLMFIGALCCPYASLCFGLNRPNVQMVIIHMLGFERKRLLLPHAISFNLTGTKCSEWHAP